MGWLEFEAASIKPNADGNHRMVTRLTGGGPLNVIGATLRDLICAVYLISDYHIQGGLS